MEPATGRARAPHDVGSIPTPAANWDTATDRQCLIFILAYFGIVAVNLGLAARGVFWLVTGS